MSLQIAARSSHIRGAIKLALRDSVKAVYGFLDAGDVVGHNTDGTPRVISIAQARAHNRELVQALTTLNGVSKFLFVYQVCLVSILF